MNWCFAAERHELRRDLSKDVEVQLMQHFLSFANFSNHGELLIDMDGVNFAKYCADTRIIGGGVKSRDVDLAFMGAKVKGTRRINFDHFLRALKTLGERRGLSLSDMVEVCLMNEGPINNSATKVSNIRLHDDKVWNSLGCPQSTRRMLSMARLLPCRCTCTHQGHVAVFRESYISYCS